MSVPHPKQLLEELNKLESLRDPKKAGNRQFRRFPVRREAEIHPVSRSRLDATPILIHVRDVSRGGIGFVTQTCPEVNSTWRVCFLSHGYVIGGQAALIRHSRTIGEGIYLVGGQFVLDSGLMTLLDIDPAHIHDSEATGESDFVPPGDA
jgi:hypothetical protein